MFRDGQYLEVIKASDDCLATVVVTVQERTVEIERRKVTTNKWLQVEDWAALYKILKQAVLRNSRNRDGSHHESRRKSTRQLDVTYTFEPPECTNDMTSLPTIKVHVSPARKKSVKRETSNEKVKLKTEMENVKEKKFPDRTIVIKDRLSKVHESSMQIRLEETESLLHASVTAERESLKQKKKQKYMLSDDLENASLEEYIPDTPKKSCPEFKYVPSRKSALESMQSTSNEYTPTLCNSNCVGDDGIISYVPNSIEMLEATYEAYEPCSTMMISDDILEEYVPNSKGIEPSIEEYEPDFKSRNKLIKFDESYIPSSVRQNGPNESKETPNKLDKLKMQRQEVRRKGTTIHKKIENLFS